MPSNVAAIVSKGMRNNPRRWRMNDNRIHDLDSDIVLRFNQLPRFDVTVVAGPNGPENLPPGIARKLCRDINWWRSHGPFERRPKP